MSRRSPAWQELEADAIQVLTRAAHETTRSTGGQDFVAFLVRVLSSTAANVGGPQRLRTDRADPAASGHLHALLRGTAGDDLDRWLPHRTQPVLITLNVAEIVEGGLHPELLSLAAAIHKIIAQGLRNCTPTTGAQQQIEAITARYRHEYRSYAEHFTVAAQAAGLRHGLRVGVHIVADTNPSSDWRSQTALTNPCDRSVDQVAYTLWKIAHDAVSLPDVALADVRAIDPHRPTKESEHGNH